MVVGLTQFFMSADAIERTVQLPGSRPYKDDSMAYFEVPGSQSVLSA